MKSSDLIIQILKENGIEKFVCFTGGAIAHLVDAAYRDHINGGSLEPITVMHEQAGSMMVDGYCRSTGKLAAMAVTSGPGATNLITGMASSWYDSIPGLYISGQVRTWEYKWDSKQRQLGFQETDIVSIVDPITNYATMISKPEDIRYEIEKAIWLSTHNRPGPVLIDLPMDMQWAEVDEATQRHFVPEEPFPNDELACKVQYIADLLSEAEKPMIISGGGVRNAGATEELLELVEKNHIPVAVTFGGSDTIARDNLHYAGLIGSMGNKSANHALNESDLVIAIGTRLSWRQVKSKPDEFLPNAKLVHVEIDPDEINQHVKCDLGVVSDAKSFIEELARYVQPKSTEWVAQVRTALEENPFCKPEYYNDKEGVNQYVFYKELAERMGNEDILVADAGQNVMWAMQGFEVKGKQRLYTAHAHSPMGYAVAGAMGAAAHFRDGTPTVAATIGDGGFQVNIQELQTIHQYKLPVKIFIMNNDAYGAIKDYQDSALEGRHYASSREWGIVQPNLLKIVKAYDLPVMEINSHDELDKINEVLNYDGPIVCNVRLIPNTYVTLDA